VIPVGSHCENRPLSENRQILVLMRIGTVKGERGGIGGEGDEEDDGGFGAGREREGEGGREGAREREEESGRRERKEGRE